MDEKLSSGKSTQTSQREKNLEFVQKYKQNPRLPTSELYTLRKTKGR